MNCSLKSLINRVKSKTIKICNKIINIKKSVRITTVKAQYKARDATAVHSKAKISQLSSLNISKPKNILNINPITLKAFK